MNFVFFIIVLTLFSVNRAWAQISEPQADLNAQLMSRVSNDCPMLFERYCTHHSYCLKPNSSCEILAYYPTNDDINTIVNLHNKYRSMAAGGTDGLPPASDMLQMEWDDELAAVAQQYAEQCRYKHDPSNCRRVMNFGVGQNLAIQTLTGGHTTPQPDWNFAVSIWYSEIIYVTPQIVSTFSAPTGGEYRHFSQLTWAQSFRVGCGYVLYKTGTTFGDQTLTRLYVCNYGPSGNVYGESIWNTGSPCTDCPINSCCGSSCNSQTTYSNLCKRTGSAPPMYPPPPNLFYCAFGSNTDCANSIQGDMGWMIEPALGGNYLEIVLEGGQNSTIVFNKMIQPTGMSFCLSLMYRKGPNIAGEENSNQASEVLSVPEIGYTHTQPLMDYPQPQRQQFSTFNLTLSFSQATQLKLNFNVPPGKPAQFFDVKSIIAVNGPCQNS